MIFSIPQKILKEKLNKKNSRTSFKFPKPHNNHKYIDPKQCNFMFQIQSKRIAAASSQIGIKNKFTHTSQPFTKFAEIPQICLIFLFFRAALR